VRRHPDAAALRVNAEAEGAKRADELWVDGDAAGPGDRCDQAARERKSSRPGTLKGRIGGEAREGTPIPSIDNSNPTKAVLRANLGRDNTSLRPSRRTDDLHKELNHPIANCPIGRASGSGATRVHSHRAPARTAALPQAQPRWGWNITGSPAPTPPTLVSCLAQRFTIDLGKAILSVCGRAARH
jgi:hypothetical protein